jgi:hypothetical protein
VGLQIVDELEKEAAHTKLMQEFAEAVNTAARMLVFTPESMRDRVLELARQGRDPKNINTQFVSNLRDLAEYFSTFLLTRRWQVWRSPSGVEFVTSDNPVVNFIPLSHGPFHPGHGFNRPGVLTALPLSPGKCLVVGSVLAGPESLTVSNDVVEKTNEALISICDRYVYSKARSDNTQKMVQLYAGTFRYGQNALMPVGLKLPTVRGYLRRLFGLDAEE